MQSLETFTGKKLPRIERNLQFTLDILVLFTLIEISQISRNFQNNEGVLTSNFKNKYYISFKNNIEIRKFS